MTNPNKIATYIVGSIKPATVHASTAIGATGPVVRSYGAHDVVLSSDPCLLRASGADGQVDLYGGQVVDGKEFHRDCQVWIGTVAKTSEPRLGDRMTVDLDAPYRVAVRS